MSVSDSSVRKLERAPMESAGEPRRSLGLAATTSLVIGNMVGSGVFLLPASLAAYGVYSLWGWVASTAGALLLARVFSRLSRRVPLAGGPYAYPREVFGDFAGFLLTWMYWISIAAAVAGIAVAFASYLAAFIPALGTRPAGAGVALAATWLLTGVNILGVRTAGRLQIVTVVLKISPLLVFALWGIFYFNPHMITSGVTVQSGPAALDTSAALTMWAFLGLECATIPTDHVKEPEKTIPRATYYGTLVAAAFYILCTTAVMGIIPAGSLVHSNAPFADAAKLVWGGWAGNLIALAASISCFGALNGWILIQGEMPRVLAREKIFPELFAHESRYRTPDYSLFITSALVTIVMLMNYSGSMVSVFTFIILISTSAYLVMYLFCSLAAFKLALRGDMGMQGRKLLWLLAVAMLGALYSAWTLWGAGKEAFWWGMGLFALGLPLYFLMKEWQRRQSASAAVSPSQT